MRAFVAPLALVRKDREVAANSGGGDRHGTSAGGREELRKGGRKREEGREGESKGGRKGVM
jgi:hypothetical protein